MSDNILLQMKNVKKSFGTNVVLTDVNLSVDAGEVVAVLGENGAGKSTLIKILGGIYKADEGEIQISGETKEITSPAVAAQNGIAIIHQEIILVPERSIAANVFLGRELKNSLGLVDKGRMERETQKIIDELNLDLRADQLVSELNMGMQQLVEVIKSISTSAKIIVMDEPTSSLSNAEVDILFGIVQKLRENRVGIIYISHKMDEIFKISQHIVVLRDGKLVGNVRTEEADRDNLIQLMVGRRLKNYFIRGEHESQGTSLEVKNFSHNKYFRNVNFYARYGEVVGFFGLVGAGRSEVMKTIFGTYSSAGGDIFLDGEKITIKSPRDSIKRGIAYIPEDRRSEGLVLIKDVKFNMGLASIPDYVNNFRVRNKEWDDLVEKMRKSFSIKFSSSRQKTGDLSGGNQQKIVLSKWLARNPGIIIMDEPTRGIDVGAKAEIYSVINDLARENKSIIIVSSELEEIINICDRCYVMHEGEITGELDKKDFSQETIMKYAVQ